MANTIQLKQGNVTLDLDDNTNFKVKNIVTAEPEPRRVSHRPDEAPPQTVRAIDQDRVVRLTVAVCGTGACTADQLLNNLIKLKRLVDSADSQSELNEIDGYNDPVYLELKLNGSTNTTRHRVKGGNVEDGASVFTILTERSKAGNNVTVTLILAPYGELTTTITVENHLNNAAFLIPGTVANLAANWNVTGASTLSLNTTDYLIGGQAQEVTFTAGSSIQSDSVTGAGDDVVGYIWIRVKVADVIVVLQENEAAAWADVQTKTIDTTDSGSVSDKSVKDRQNNTWYRVTLSGTVTTTANAIRLMVRGESSDRFIIDAAYIEPNTSTIPNAWIGSRLIDNRNDLDTTNVTRINYVDAWDIPGDVPALVTHKLDSDASGNDIFMAARDTDGTAPAGQVKHWIESEGGTNNDLFSSFATSGTGTWVQSTGTGTSNDDYVQYTEAGAATGGTYKMQGGGGDDWRKIFAKPRRVYIRAWTDEGTPTDVNLTLNIVVNTSNEKTIFSGAVLQIPVASSWVLLDCGLFNGTDIVPDTSPGGTANTPNSVGFNVVVSGLTSGKIFRFDFIEMLPVTEFIISEFRNALGGTAVFWMVGDKKEVIGVSDNLKEEYLGEMWQLAEGPTASRTIYTQLNSDLSHTLTHGFTVSYVITPRTRHLLGTI